jgi:flagellar motility protein MotE (MotC chaperone)
MARRLISILVLMGAVGLLSFSYALAQSPAAPEKKVEDPQDTIRIEMAKDLVKRQEELNRREEQLQSREGQLKVLEQEVERKIEELKRTQLKLEEAVKVRDDLEAKNVSNLSKAYSSMPAPEAAARLKTMDRGVALRILMAMKTKNSSKILSSLDPQTAAQISEQLAKRQTE